MVPAFLYELQQSFKVESFSLVGNHQQMESVGQSAPLQIQQSFHADCQRFDGCMG